MVLTSIQTSDSNDGLKPKQRSYLGTLVTKAPKLFSVLLALSIQDFWLGFSVISRAFQPLVLIL